MDNKEFIRRFAELIMKPFTEDKTISPREITGLVFDARKMTEMKKSPIDTLAADLVVTRDSKDRKLNFDYVAESIEIRREATEDDFYRLYHNKGFEKVKDLESALKFFAASTLGIPYDETCEKVFAFNGRLTKLVEGVDKQYTSAKLVTPQGSARAYSDFMHNALAYFGSKLEGTENSTFVALVATSLLAHSEFGIESEAARHVDAMVEALIVRVSKGRNKADIESVVKRAANMTAQLEWALDNPESELAKQNKAPSYSKIDAKYKEAEKYLHDVALFRKLIETTMNAEQSMTGVTEGTPLSYVGFGGGIVADIVPAFANSHTEDADVNDRTYGIRYLGEGDKSARDTLFDLMAVANNDGQRVLKILESGQRDGKIDLQEATKAILALRYSGASSEDVAQFAESLGDAFGELSNQYLSQEDFSDSLRETVKEIVGQLIEVRDGIIPQAKTVADEEAQTKIEQIERELGGLSLDRHVDPAPVDPAPVAPEKPKRVRKAPTQEEKDVKFQAEIRKRVRQTLAESIYGNGDRGIIRIDRIKGKKGVYQLASTTTAEVLGTFALPTLDGDYRLPIGRFLIDESISKLLAPKTKSTKAIETAVQQVILDSELLESKVGPLTHKPTDGEAE